VSASSDAKALGVQDLVVIAVKTLHCWMWRVKSGR
jgi:hypothetical protein